MSWIDRKEVVERKCNKLYLNENIWWKKYKMKKKKQLTTKQKKLKFWSAERKTIYCEIKSEKHE